MIARATLNDLVTNRVPKAQQKIVKEHLDAWYAEADKTDDARFEALMSAAPNTPEGDELDVLATLVDAYEAKHFIMDAPSPVAAILFRMEQEQLSRKDLEPLIGSRARVSEVLTG